MLDLRAPKTRISSLGLLPPSNSADQLHMLQINHHREDSSEGEGIAGKVHNGVWG